MDDQVDRRCTFFLEASKTVAGKVNFAHNLSVDATHQGRDGRQAGGSLSYLHRLSVTDIEAGPRGVHSVQIMACMAIAQTPYLTS